MHVVLAGGGTAGHVEPALATADALRRRLPDVGITMLGTARGLETRLVPQRGYELALIPPVPLPRTPTPALFSVPARMRAAVRDVAGVLARAHADVVVGFGGYVALPAYLAARGEKVPYVVHEANAKPGLANRWGARFTPFVAVNGSARLLPHATTVGIPLRRAVAELDRPAERDAARREFGLRPDAPTLLVSGGSQGARSINHAVVAAAPALAAAGVQVLHVAGPAQLADVEARLPRHDAGAPPYVVMPYVERMERAYAAADVMMCRAGAMTCAELAAVGLPAVYVPLPHGNGEQRLNAMPTVDAGGGLLVSDAELTGDWIAANVVPLVTDGGRLADMAAKAAASGHRDADEFLVDMVLAAARGRSPSGRRK